ncbi:hypothetical protein EAG_12681 [Camponotus floridanus]|uniref:Uncharacterized protein n=1 Tax=Camponotus floridanus TaxID=104421 RepID=E2AXX4_CAMFO|nr:hypothetical protein EAG_12681 [Camponotus floridanus]
MYTVFNLLEIKLINSDARRGCSSNTHNQRASVLFLALLLKESTPWFHWVHCFIIALVLLKRKRECFKYSILVKNIKLKQKFGLLTTRVDVKVLDSTSMSVGKWTSQNSCRNYQNLKLNSNMYVGKWTNQNSCRNYQMTLTQPENTNQILIRRSVIDIGRTPVSTHAASQRARQPTRQPTNQPTRQPTNQPTNQPTYLPTYPPPPGVLSSYRSYITREDDYSLGRLTGWLMFAVVRVVRVLLAELKGSRMNRYALNEASSNKHTIIYQKAFG